MGIRAVYQCVFFYVYLHSDDNNDDDESKFWVFDFYETFICYGGCLNLNCYISKKVQKKFSYGFSNLVKLGVEIINFKITIGRTVFDFSTKTSVFCEAGWSFWYIFCHFWRRSRQTGGEAARPAAQPPEGRRSRPASRKEGAKRPPSRWSSLREVRGYDSPKLIVASRGTSVRLPQVNRRFARYEGTTPPS